MPRSRQFRFVIVAILASTFVPVAFSQSQDTQSVAEAARKAREKKKDAAKPAKVITDETLDVKKGDVQSAVAEEDKIAGAPQAISPQTLRLIRLPRMPKRRPPRTKSLRRI